MSYVPHTDAERQQMLSAIGVTTIEDLFDAVPASHRFPEITLPGPLSELEVVAELTALAEANEGGQDFALFRGAGAYQHFIPSAVNHVLLRSEFYSAYTPYQPEMSQGTLQAVFEYQSMMCALLGVEAANASHYDGGTSLAEAVTMAHEIKRGKRHKVILSHSIHPHYRQIVRTYHQGGGIKFVGDRGRADIPDLIDMLDDDTAMLAVAYPNFLGQVDDLRTLAQHVHAAGALLCMVVNPMALGMFKSPGELGADIVVGEGQPLGIPLGYGGPYLGFFGTRQKYVRKIAGRLVGETVDADGTRAYTMTLRPREQDIRREKATSNICTNQGLMTVATAVYLSLMGKHGMQQVARLNYHKAHYAARQIDALPGYSVDRSKPFFNEFMVTCPVPVQQVNDHLIANGIIGGYELGQDYDHLQDVMLLAVTEMNSRAEIDELVSTLAEVEA
jgi:glycine dehydrogenase subunit 1